MINVIKIGGNIVDNPEALDQFLSDFSKLPGQNILIHGGGKVATKISAALGIETKMVEGRRVTDKDTLEVVTMVYAGLVNKTIVSKLQALNTNAIGLSGADANIIKSHKRTNSSVDYGFVGDIDHVDADKIHSLLHSDLTPVIAPITHDKKGQLLNTNADSVASQVARSLKARLVYCFELPGVMKDINDENSLIARINQEYYTELKTGGIIADGMIPKLDNCFEALNAGVSKVCICQANQILNLDSGTFVGTELEL